MKALLKKLWWRLNTSRKCSWCGRWMYRAPSEWLNFKRRRVTHGVCHGCLRELTAEIVADEEERLTVRQKGAKVNP